MSAIATAVLQGAAGPLSVVASAADGGVLGGRILRTVWTLAAGAMVLYVVAVLVLLGLSWSVRVGRARLGAAMGGRLGGVGFLLALASVALFVYPQSAVVGYRCKGPAPDPMPAATAVPAGGPSTGGPVGSGSAQTLVLYDTGGSESWLGELAAVQTANLVSRFGSWRAQPVTGYTAGTMARYDAVVYLGTNDGQALPRVFLADVLAGKTPVVWVNYNLAQLRDSNPGRWSARYGFTPGLLDTSPITSVLYKGVQLTRDPANDNGITAIAVRAGHRTRVLATAAGPQGHRLPWAVRAGNLTYVAEDPYGYAEAEKGDRYLAFTDLLFDALAPTTHERHRALVRLEDIGPNADPDKLREVAELLDEEDVPFSFGVYPVYEDPNGVAHNGRPTTIRLSQRPEVVEAIRHLIACGGTMVMHGVTHQYADKANPYRGQSGDDYEFYRAHVDARDYVQLDGPVPEDSTQWASDRIAQGLAEFEAAGLPAPQIFELPHYAGSASDYQAVARHFRYRYEQAMYFGGQLTGGRTDWRHSTDQFFPYPVRDVYGTVVLPENLGNYIPVGYNHNPPRSANDIVATARRELVVRDGVASFFYHPYLGAEQLRPIVTGLRALGYSFVSPREASTPPGLG